MLRVTEGAFVEFSVRVTPEGSSIVPFQRLVAMKKESRNDLTSDGSGIKTGFPETHPLP